MTAIGRLFNTITTSLSALTISGNLDESAMPASYHQPSVKDVLEVKAFIHKASSSKLPIEIIDEIIDFAEYWPHSSTAIVARKSCTARAGGRGPEDIFCLRSMPVGYYQDDDCQNKYSLPMKSFGIPNPICKPHSEVQNAENNVTNKVLEYWKSIYPHRGQHPCRKIVFTMESKDQGWGGSSRNRATYKGSYSWFDVGKEHFEALNVPANSSVSQPTEDYCQLVPDDDESELICVPSTIEPEVVQEPSRHSDVENAPTYKFNHPFLPSSTSLQANVVAGKTDKEHVITWSADDNVQEDSPEAIVLENEGRGKATGNGNFVRDLQMGDIITVWARARFPGWRNDVSKLAIDVYWAV